ncbi:MAG: type II toxin-antitoxin system RelE/ParE family toxin [Thermoleophilia bacterium]|nr:type II toxin-antitoxin system RelE/ParE family toxin [Thermoleophilia bacterium]
MEIEHHDEREFAKWYVRLGPVEKRKLRFELDRLEMEGVRLGLPHVRELGDGLYELRVRVGQQPRLYFEYASSSRVRMLTYGRKDTQDRDIRRARGRMT